ncbi:MAG: T9SS type A sorting domain-containing protein [Cyclobacteriaceae bacterium]|nr:T9SS type A sorting domain-containing protein [Cyclobacteriaceae bacterium]
MPIYMIQAQQNPLLDQNPIERPILRDRPVNIKNPVEFYPNPVEQYLTVSIDRDQLKNVEFEVYNIIGNTHQIEVEDLSRSQFKIHLDNFKSGYYLLVVKDKENRVSHAYKFQVR